MTKTEESPIATIERLVRATNDHDLEQVVACFRDDYALVSPVHPQRSFRGKDQVRRNWTQIFGAVPDILTTLVRSAVDGESVWTEWEMAGTRRDGAAHDMRGVFIFGVTAGQIHWGRMFLESVDESGGDMNKALRDQLAANANDASGGGAR